MESKLDNCFRYIFIDVVKQYGLPEKGIIFILPNHHITLIQFFAPKKML